MLIFDNLAHKSVSRSNRPPCFYALLMRAFSNGIAIAPTEHREFAIVREVKEHALILRAVRTPKTRIPFYKIADPVDHHPS